MEQNTTRLMAGLLALSLLFVGPVAWAQESEPGRGATAEFEMNHLRFIVDHHYAALRLTEIAAGTAEIRQADIVGDEGVSPTPETDALEGRAELDVVRSIAREVNRRHREEIFIAQRYLRDLYGIEHSPQLSEENQALIQELEQIEAPEDFDQRFLQVLSQHHYQGLVPSINCIVGRDILHDQLYRLCKGILETQLLEIEEMRELLSIQFGIDDFQAFTPFEDGSTGGNGDGVPDTGSLDGGVIVVPSNDERALRVPSNNDRRIPFPRTNDRGLPLPSNSVNDRPADEVPQPEPFSSNAGSIN